MAPSFGTDNVWLDRCPIMTDSNYEADYDNANLGWQDPINVCN